MIDSVAVREDAGDLPLKNGTTLKRVRHPAVKRHSAVISR